MPAESIVIAQPDREEIEASYSPLVARAESIRITCAEEHGAAQEYLGDLARAKRVVGDRLDPIIKQAHAAHKGLTTLRGDLLRPIEAARAVVSRKLDSYEAEERRRAEEARIRAEAEARRQEEEAQLAAALAAEEAGDATLAEEIIQETPVAPVVHVPRAVTKVEGVHSQRRRRAVVVNLGALIRYVAEHPEWEHLLQASMPALNGLARSQGDAMCVPGVEVVSETVRAVRA